MYFYLNKIFFNKNNSIFSDPKNNEFQFKFKLMPKEDGV